MALALAFLFQLGCDQEPVSTEDATPEQIQEQLVASGQKTYYTLCIACHSPNPALEGVQGPAVINSSLELLELKVLEGRYPEGYQPKHDTELMPPLEMLRPEIPALAAFLNQ